MKNLLALFLCLSVIAFANTVCFKNDLSNCNGNVTVVSDLKKSYPVYASVIESGGKSYITADIQYLNTFQKNIKNIYGITLKLKNVSVNDFINKYNVKIIKNEIINGKTVYYGYSNSFNNHIFLDNKMANVQIVDGQVLTVGIPAILDSF